MPDQLHRGFVSMEKPTNRPNTARNVLTSAEGRPDQWAGFAPVTAMMTPGGMIFQTSRRMEPMRVWRGWGEGGDQHGGGRGCCGEVLPRSVRHARVGEADVQKGHDDERSTCAEPSRKLADKRSAADENGGNGKNVCHDALPEDGCL